jgi:hypothetical protein
MYDNYRLREAFSRSLPMLVIIFMLIILSKATHRHLSLQLNCPIMSLPQSSARYLPSFTIVLPRIRSYSNITKIHNCNVSPGFFRYYKSRALA